MASIKNHLQTQPVLRSRQQGVLRPIKELRYRLLCNNDQHGNPLFADLRPELYLSDSYAWQDIALLEKFGLSALYMNEIVATVKQDLSLVGPGLFGRPMSRMKASETDDDWHSKAASLLSLPFRMKWHDQIQEIKELELIPLHNGLWVPAIIGDIYYPSVGSIPIPRDLGLRLLHPDAAKNAKRRELFNHLGVILANTRNIRSLVLGRYDRDDFRHINLDTSSGHLRFLYLTHNSRSEWEDNNRIQIYNHLGVIALPSSFDLYIPDDHPYGAQGLLGFDGACALGISFVHAKYLEDPPEKPSGMALTWTEWVYEYLRVRRHIRLVGRHKKSLSRESEFIAKHRPQKFLCFLKHLWPFEGELVLLDTNLLTALKRTEVPCIGGRKQQLSETYLPLPGLQELRRRFMEGEYFPFVELPVSAGNGDLSSQWSFLTNGPGVGFKDDLEFRLRILGFIKEANTIPLGMRRVARLADLYEYIEASCMESRDRLKPRTRTREFFEKERCIFIPSRNGSNATWAAPSECLWDAPEDTISKQPLQALYSTAFATLGVVVNVLSGFFQRTLEVPDMSCTHIIAELKAIKRLSAARLETVRRLYQRLHETPLLLSFNEDSMRESFEQDALVYVERQGTSSWHRPSECLWSSTTKIEGKIAINAQYKDLKVFFTERLKVRLVDLKMVHDELLEVHSRNTSAEDVKPLLWAFNSLLQSEYNPPNPSRMLQRRVFPVRTPNGQVTLHSSQTEFAIVDREGYFNAFRDRVKVLDFSLQEICRLKPFIAWARLEPRYLSKCVKEVSRLEDEVAIPVSAMNRDLKRKAYGLLRIAASYNSPRFDANAQGLYDLLRGAVTVETEGILSRPVLEQDGILHEVEIGKSELHIEENGNFLTIYVPRNEDLQEYCFKSKLPRRFVAWMMTDPAAGTTGKIEDAAINVVNSVLDCLVSAVPAILQGEGVVEVDVPDLSQEDAQMWAPEPPRSERPTAVLPLTPFRERNHSSHLPPRMALSDAETPESLSSPGEILDYPTPLTDPEDYDDEAGASIPVDLGRRPAFGVSVRELQYQKLLERVVTLARRMTLPEFGSLNMSGMLEGLSIQDDVFGGLGTFYSSEWERHRKVGAAGELVVFELLSNLDPSLLGFNRDNWQSTIRKYAQAHPEYADLTPWGGTETSDIVYDDVSGVFTTLLIEKRYLSGTNWEGKTPKYYIEVKSTTDQCSTPFFVSDGQLDRMQRTSNGPSGNSNQSEIYAVFRVFNLGKDSMGLRIYIDPEEQRKAGKLRFTTDKWVVVPMPGY